MRRGVVHLHLKLVLRVLDTITAEVLSEVLTLLVNVRVAVRQRVVIIRDLDSDREETFEKYRRIMDDE